jgi:iron complex transport system ATP-binding protein
MTVLTVLHDLNLASTYCDQLVLLREGRVAAQGSPSEVLTSERLAEVYGLRIWCEPHAQTGRPYVLPIELPGQEQGRSCDGGGRSV